MTTEDLIPTHLATLNLQTSSTYPGISLATALPGTDVIVTGTGGDPYVMAFSHLTIKSLKFVTDASLTAINWLPGGGNPQLDALTLDFTNGAGSLTVLQFISNWYLQRVVFNYAGGAPGSITDVNFSGCSLDSTTIESLLAMLISGSAINGLLDISGGRNAAPVPVAAGAKGQYSYTCANPPDMPGAGNEGGYFIINNPASMGSTRILVWFNVDGGNSQPATPADTYVEIDCVSSSDSSAVAALLAAVLPSYFSNVANDPSSSVVTFESQQSGVVGGSGGSVGSVNVINGGADFVPSGNVTILQGRGWTVTTN